MSCWEQFGALLAWEADDPELLAEHFLTVATFNLQHPAQFTDEALTALRDTFIDHLDRGLPVPEIRSHMSKEFEGSRRVQLDEAKRQPNPRIWSMTITDVYIPEKPEGAAERVRVWAKSIRDEL